MSEKKERPYVDPESDEVSPEDKSVIEELSRSHGKSGGSTVRGKSGAEAHDESIRKLLTEDKRREEENRTYFRGFKKPEPSRAGKSYTREGFVPLFPEHEKNGVEKIEHTYETFDHGSVAEIFYRTLNKTHPEIGIHIQEEVEGKKKHLVAELVEPENEHIIVGLRNHPILQVLEMPTEYRRQVTSIGLKLEKEGKLDPDTTKRSVVRALTYDLKQEEELNGFNTEKAKRIKAQLKELYTQPLRDSEIRKLIGQIIEEELEKK